MVGNLPEHRIDRPLLNMAWRNVAFLHWSYEPAEVQALLPPQVQVDTFDGRAWVGLVAFEMVDVRLPATPALPGVSTFPETNVRTYVRDARGRDGLWFFTLEAARLVSVLADPIIGISYAWADMAVSCRGQEVRYASRRRLPFNRQARTRLGVEYGRPLPPHEQSDFDHYLTGRWQAYSARRGHLYATPVEHEPWPLHQAATTLLDDGLVAACGLPIPTEAPIVHYAPAVNVSLGVPRVV